MGLYEAESSAKSLTSLKYTVADSYCSADILRSPRCNFSVTDLSTVITDIFVMTDDEEQRRMQNFGKGRGSTAFGNWEATIAKMKFAVEIVFFAAYRICK